MDWFDLFAVQGTLKVLSNTTVQKRQSIPQSINTTVKSINQKKQKNEAFTYSTMTEMNCHAIDIKCGLQSMGLQRVGHG